MKRSEKFFQQARQSFWAAATLSAAAICAGTWSARVYQSTAPGGVAVGLAAIAGLFLAAVSFRECLRLLALHQREERYEWAREVRPRL